MTTEHPSWGPDPSGRAQPPWPPAGPPQWGPPATPQWAPPPPGPPRPSKAPGIVVLILGIGAVVFGLILVLGSTLNVTRDSALRHRGVQTEGQVVGTVFPVQDRISYNTPEGRFVEAMGRPRASDELPDGSVEVIYDPQHPERADIAHIVNESAPLSIGLLIGSSFVVVLGIGGIVGGAILLRRANRPPKLTAYWYGQG